MKSLYVKLNELIANNAQVRIIMINKYLFIIIIIYLQCRLVWYSTFDISFNFFAKKIMFASL